MTQPLVFDHTALIALFRGYSTVYDYWTQADAGGLRIVMPAAAVAEANRMLRSPWSGWSAVLYPNDVAVSPLDEHTAVEAGLMGDVATGHVAYEARAVLGVVVTQAPEAYQNAKLPLLVI